MRKTTRQKAELLKEKSQKVEMGGGKNAIGKLHATGRLSARERFAVLFDEGSFVELDKFVEHRFSQQV